MQSRRLASISPGRIQSLRNLSPCMTLVAINPPDPYRRRWHARETMKVNYQSVYKKLQRIYEKHYRNHPENPNSEQMCCMWSTSDPPDIIKDTPPFDDIEDTFSIAISDDIAFELYDMNLSEAARKIMEIRNEQQ